MMKQTTIQPNTRPTSELMLRETASQTAGPYVHIGLALAAAGNPVRDEEIWNEMAKPDAEGEPIEIVGTVVDGNGDLVRDAFLEAWQADANGNYQADYDLGKPFNSFGRTATTFDHGSEWSLSTIKPGAVKHPSGQLMAPHINLAIFARGSIFTCKRGSTSMMKLKRTPSVRCSRALNRRRAAKP